MYSSKTHWFSLVREAFARFKTSDIFAMNLFFRAISSFNVSISLQNSLAFWQYPFKFKDLKPIYNDSLDRIWSRNVQINQILGFLKKHRSDLCQMNEDFFLKLRLDFWLFAWHARVTRDPENIRNENSEDVDIPRYQVFYLTPKNNKL